jgi:hypothetical protein
VVLCVAVSCGCCCAVRWLNMRTGVVAVCRNEVLNTVRGMDPLHDDCDH